MQTGDHPVRFQMLVQQLSEIPELRVHQQPNCIGIWRCSVDAAEECYRLFRFVLHQLVQHDLHRAAVTAAEKQGAFVIALGQEPDIDAFLKINGVQKRFCGTALLSLLVLRRSRGKIVVQLAQKALEETDKQRILIFIPRVDRAGCDVGFFGNLVERGFLETVGQKLRIGSLDDSIVQRMISIGYDVRLLIIDSAIIDNGVIIAWESMKCKSPGIIPGVGKQKMPPYGYGLKHTG